MSRPKIINLNKDEPVFYPLNIKVNKCSGDCNNINYPMEKLCVPDIVKDMNIKVFNLLARINETRKIVWYLVIRVNAYVDWRQLFAMIGKNGMKTNADANVKKI